MVAHRPPAADAFRLLLEDLYRGLAGLSTTGYQWDPSDGWHQTRGPLVDGAPQEHLEVWIDLGGISEMRGSSVLYDSSLVYSVRYVEDDDSQSQAILHASLADVWSHLTTWTREPYSVRTRPESATIEAAAAAWLVVTVRFTTSINWRA